MALTEQHSGLRLCRACNKLLPLNCFRMDKRKYTCIEHLKARKRKMILGTTEKRCFNSLRCRARHDMLAFGHTKMQISRKLINAILTDDQIEDFTHHCVIPTNPDKILSADNIVVVNTWQRSYVIRRWRASKSTEQYIRDLTFILNAPDSAELKQ